MHARTGEALKAGVKLLKEMKGHESLGLVMSSLSDLAGCHYMVSYLTQSVAHQLTRFTLRRSLECEFCFSRAGPPSDEARRRVRGRLSSPSSALPVLSSDQLTLSCRRFAMPPMLTTEEYLSISDSSVPTITEMTSQDELSVIFTLDRQNIDVPPTMTHLHLTLQEAIISPMPLDLLLPKTWKTVDILLTFIGRLLASMSPDADDYPAMVQHIVTRELSYLGLEIICFRRLWMTDGMDWEVRERLMIPQKERLLGVTPRLVEGIRLLLSLEMEPARVSCLFPVLGFD